MSELAGENIPGLLAHYPVHFFKNVEWGDMDAMQHVNNVRYFYYAESARLQLLAKLVPAFGDGSLAQASEAYTLAETSCRYKVSLTWPDSLVIASAVESVDANSFIVRHVIYSNKLELVAAELSARLVRYDFARGCRSEIPQGELELLEKYRITATGQ